MLKGAEKVMNFIEYQKAAMRTRGQVFCKQDMLNVGALGISGEAGEVTDNIKKVLFHGHKFDADKVAEELGDVMWYVAYLSDAIGIDLETIAEKNIEKLQRRYPNGFSNEDSINRKE